MFRRLCRPVHPVQRAWLAAAMLGAVAHASRPADAVLALVGGTIYPAPDAAPIHDGVVVVNGRGIAAVGSRASVNADAD